MSSYYSLNRRADFKITTIDGKRCTAVPRNLPSTTTTTTRAQAPVKESETPTVDESTVTNESSSPVAIATTTPSPAASSTTNPLTTASSLSSTTRSSAVTIPTPEAISDTRPTDPRPARPEITTTSPGTDDEVDNSTPAKSTTLLDGTTPSPTIGRSRETDIPTLTPAAESRSNKGAIVGGVVGTLILLAIIGVILFLCRRRRRRRRNPGSLLSPLESANREKFYEIDRGSLGPTKRSARWRQEISARAENAAWDLKTTVAGFGTSLKATVSKDRSDASPVNLVPEKTERFHSPFSHHHRNESSILSISTGRSSVRERLAGWRRRFGEVWALQRQGNEPKEPEPHFGDVPDSRVQSAIDTIGDRYRDSDQSGSTATRDLGLSLMDSQTSDLLKLENQPQDPFADPYADPFSDPEHGSLIRTKAIDHPLNNPFGASDGNPFSEQIITNPASIVPRPQTYIQQVRRSRGSMSSTPPSNRSSRSTELISFIERPNSIALSSRVPSLIEFAHAGERDTIYSSVSADRRGKGRSDPFDLERPELWILPSQQRGNASRQAGNGLSSSGVGANGVINGSLTIKATSNGDFKEAGRELERRRNVDNVSPVSALSVDI